MRSLPLRLHPGADLRRALEEAAVKQPGGSAFVVSGIGSLEAARLRYAGEAAEALIEGPLEILSLSGTLGASGAHLHMSVSDAVGRVQGGHVGYGNTVRTTAEVLLVPLQDWSLTREHDPATGFNELVVRPGPPLVLYGAAASGSVAVEAALTCLGIPFTVVEGATWASEAARTQVGATNPMRQIPTLVWPGGEVMTESAAILIHLADRHPAARLAPQLDDPTRGQFLRWMLYVSSAIYALHWIKPDVSRIGAPAGSRDAVVQAVHERIAHCWSVMDTQLNPRAYLLGDELTVLDLYVAVVSRFGPWRERFYQAAPRMAAVVHQVDAEPRLAALWRERFPED